LALISEFGYGKIISLKEIRKAQISDLGTQAFRFKKKEDNLIAMFNASLVENTIALTNKGRKLPVNLNKMSLSHKDQQPVNFIKLKNNEKIIEVVC
jgi:DNA gyrase subunit A